MGIGPVPAVAKALGRAGVELRDVDLIELNEACHFVWVNRGKESLTVDFKHPAGRAVLDELIASADVVVQNLAPGTADGLGLSARQLTARHPWLIGCRFPRRYPRAGKRGWTGSRAWATILARSSWRLAATMARSAG
jgi:crotonobetainyl-CoA:carnitine CoA-transferase CaiB-like acyl-CoA transferase